MTDLIIKAAPIDEFKVNKFDVERGEISAVVTSFKNYDVVNDRIMPGALDDFLKTFEPGLNMLFQHNRSEIIGRWENFKIRGNLVIGEGKIYPDVSKGADVMKLISYGNIGATSIGFKAEEYRYNDKNGVDYEKISLVEVSMVDAPANPKARLLAAKARDGEFDINEFQTFLRQAGMTRKDSSDTLHELKKHLRQADTVEEKDTVSLLNDLLKVN